MSGEHREAVTLIEKPGRATTWRVSASTGADGGSGSGAFDPCCPFYSGPFTTVGDHPVPNVQPISSSCRRIPIRVALPGKSAENGPREAAPVLHFLPLQNARSKFLAFHSFDESYVSRLRAGDFRTQEHFSAYFGALIKIKLVSRLNRPEAVEDVRQETFSRFFAALRDGKILQPERLGSFVNSICNNVLLEYYRSSARSSSLDDEEDRDFPATGVDLLEALLASETTQKVREILEKLPERDRRILREVFIEEKDKDEVCRDFGVTRDHLRLLLHRAKKAFKAKYLKHMGDNPPDYASA